MQECQSQAEAHIKSVAWLFPQVYSLSWNLVRRNVFLSSSWDDSIKLWDMNSPASLATFKDHTYCVYAANWCAQKTALLRFHFSGAYHCSNCISWLRHT